MIEIRYKCGCMSAEVSISVLPRDPARDIIVWMEQIVTPAIGYDHKTRSPRCHRTKMEYAKLPMDPGTDMVGTQTKPS